MGPARGNAERNADTIANSVVGGRGVDPSTITSSAERGAPIPGESANGIARARASGGRPLASGIRNTMENRFDHDFSGVRVHTDGRAQNLSTSLRANAFAVGQDIFFNEGAYSPSTNAGQHLLAHELTHTIQQQRRGQESVQGSLWDDAKNLWGGVKKGAQKVWDGPKSAWYNSACKLGTLRYPDKNGAWRDDEWMCKIRQMQANPYVLAIGPKGPAQGRSVEVVHQFLRKWLCDNAANLPGQFELPHGDVYNSRSIKAVKLYQKHNTNSFLKPDGRVGHLTLGAMDIDMGGLTSFPTTCGEPDEVECNNHNFAVRNHQASIFSLAPDDVVDKNTNKPWFQPYKMVASAEVQMRNVGHATAKDWEVGFHQVVLSDKRRSIYSSGTETLDYVFSSPIRDAEPADKPPFARKHASGSLSWTSIRVHDTPFRKVDSKKKYGRLQAVELDIRLADWLIARRKDDPPETEPCYLTHFDWGLKWSYDRRPIGNRDGEWAYSEIGRNGNTGPSVPAAGVGPHTPDPSTRRANKDAPAVIQWSPRHAWIPDL